MAIGDVYRLTAVVQANATAPKCINQWYFRQEAALVFDTPEEDLVGAFIGECQTLYRGLFTNGLEVFQYAVAPVTTFETSYIEDVSGAIGTLTGEPLPPRVAALISFRTADTSRRGRGRTFLPPANEASSQGSTAVSAYRTTMDDFGNAMLNLMSVTTAFHSGWTWMLWSKADQQAKEVVSYIVRAKWSSQRDRGEIY